MRDKFGGRNRKERPRRKDVRGKVVNMKKNGGRKEEMEDKA